MNTREVTKILKDIGWMAFTDEVGDRYTHFVLPDRTVQIIYGVRTFSDEQQLEATRSLTTDVFSGVCLEISGRGGKYTPLARAWKGICIRAPEIMEEHVQQASDEAIAWAKDQDLDRALEKHAVLPTDAPGARPIWHLAALALLADVTKLKAYQSSFESGDHLGFAKYVAKDYIDRALIIAYGNLEGGR